MTIFSFQISVLVFTRLTFLRGRAFFFRAGRCEEPLATFFPPPPSWELSRGGFFFHVVTLKVSTSPPPAGSALLPVPQTADDGRTARTAHLSYLRLVLRARASALVLLLVASSESGQ